MTANPIDLAFTPEIASRFPFRRLLLVACEPREQAARTYPQVRMSSDREIRPR